MGSKRTKARRPPVQIRERHFRGAYTHKTVPRQYKEVVPAMEGLLETWLINQDEVERQVFQYLQGAGVPSEFWPWYAALAKRGFIMYMKFWDSTAATERGALRQEWILRGLNPPDIDAVLNIVQTKAGIVRP